jgi:predicted dehydrogenase
VRVAVCGLGTIGRQHADNLSSLRGCALAGVFDRDAERRDAAAVRLGVRAYRAWAEALADPAVDAVLVATPGAAHRAAVLPALEAGKHVFVEKPLADTLADARAMVAAAAASDRVVQVGFCERFNPAFVEAKCATPRLGRVAAVQSSRVAPLALAHPEWGLGVLDTAVHNFDLLLWLTGRRPVAVRAHGARLYPEVPGFTAVTTTVRCDDGLIATDYVAWLRDAAHPLAACARARLALYGERGVFEVDQTARPASLLTADGFAQPDTVITGRPEYFGCLRLQLDAFLRAVETGGPSPVPAADGLKAELVATAAQVSLATGCEVPIPEGAWPG